MLKHGDKCFVRQVDSNDIDTVYYQRPHPYLPKVHIVSFMSSMHVFDTTCGPGQEYNFVAKKYSKEAEALIRRERDKKFLEILERAKLL